MANEMYTTPETNLITTDEMGRVRTQDFVLQFTGSVDKIAELLGITRRIEVQEGSQLKTLVVSGTLEDGTVDEGAVIPLSQYETEEVVLGEIHLQKWRKSTSAEAIIKGGYDQAVGATTDKMVKDIQKGIRTSLFGYLAQGDGTATGEGLQAALANAWGQLSVAFEDDAIEPIFFLSPLDVADYLGTAQVTMQTAFGMTYIENFLGLGTVFLSGAIEQGTFYATAKDNLVLYYVAAGSGDIGGAFGFTTDELGLVGINEYSDSTRLTVDNTVVCGLDIFPEVSAGVIVGEITTPDDGGGDGEGE